MAGVLVITSWGFLLDGVGKTEVLSIPHYSDLSRFFREARKARKHLRKGEGYYR